MRNLIPAQKVLLRILPLFLIISCATVFSGRNADFYRRNPPLLLADILNRGRAIKSFEGSGHITVESPAENFQGIVEVYYKQPDSLLVILRAGFGVTVGKMLVLGSSVKLYNIRDRIVYISEDAEVPLDELIGMSLRPENLFEAVLGVPRPLNAEVHDTLHWEFRQDKIAFHQEQEAFSRFYVTDPKKRALIQYTLIHYPDDTTDCFFKQFRRMKGVRLPRHIQVTRSHPKQRLSLYYTRMRVNHKLSSSRFQLQLPGNVDIIQLGE